MKYAVEMGSGANDIHTKFHIDWSRNSKADRGRFTDSIVIS
jgi:hypothetical protein